MATKKEIITKMYRWYGLKYGLFIGVAFGLLLALIEPNLAENIYLTILYSVLALGATFSLFGLILYPLMKTTFLGSSAEPTDEEIMNFLDSRERGFFGSGSVDSGGFGGGSDGGSGD